MKKRLFIILIMACALCLSLGLAVQAFAEEGEPVEYPIGGNCGANDDNVTWSLDADGNFTLAGSGKMMEISNPNNVPWKNYFSEIKTVSIAEGIESISGSAFINVLILKSS